MGFGCVESQESYESLWLWWGFCFQLWKSSCKAKRCGRVGCRRHPTCPPLSAVNTASCWRQAASASMAPLKQAHIHRALRLKNLFDSGNFSASSFRLLRLLMPSSRSGILSSWNWPSYGAPFSFLKIEFCSVVYYWRMWKNSLRLRKSYLIIHRLTIYLRFCVFTIFYLGITVSLSL